ncbi:MAG: hypothetical protein ACP5UN_02800 [Candidatus Micrarchaeia archaeon]
MLNEGIKLNFVYNKYVNEINKTIQNYIKDIESIVRIDPQITIKTNKQGDDQKHNKNHKNNNEENKDDNKENIINLKKVDFARIVEKYNEIIGADEILRVAALIDVIIFKKAEKAIDLEYKDYIDKREEIKSKIKNNEINKNNVSNFINDLVKIIFKNYYFILKADLGNATSQIDVDLFLIRFGNNIENTTKNIIKNLNENQFFNKCIDEKEVNKFIEIYYLKMINKIEVIKPEVLNFKEHLDIPLRSETTKFFSDEESKELPEVLNYYTDSLARFIFKNLDKAKIDNINGDYLIKLFNTMGDTIIYKKMQVYNYSTMSYRSRIKTTIRDLNINFDLRFSEFKKEFVENESIFNTYLKILK